MENYQNPDWWDEWLKKNYKKQMKLLYKRRGNPHILVAVWNFIIR
jgi:hypothetical protein